MAPGSASTTVNGFTVIPISYSTSTAHYIFARAHRPSKENKLPTGRTLFLVNVPPDATERELVLLFKPCGTVEKVVFGFDAQEAQNHESDSDDDDADAEGAAAEEMETDGGTGQPIKRRKLSKEEVPKVISLPSKPHRTVRKTGLSAHVIFLDESSLPRALALSHKTRPWPISLEEPSGLAHYTAVYEDLRPPLDSIRQHVDSYMELFEYNLAKSKQKSKYRKGEAVVDEDGFTLVTRGGAYGKTLGGGVGVATKRFQRSGESTTRHRNKKENKEKEGFYAFQKAEKQRTELMNLKRRWEEDKEKVEKLKASRKFKPY